MNSTSAAATANYSFESMSRRSSMCPPHHDSSDPVLSPPLTPALSQHHPFDKRPSADLNYSPNHHYNPRSTYSMDSYHQWMNHSATMQHMQQQQIHQHQSIHHHQQHPHHHSQQHPHHHQQMLQSSISTMPQQQPQSQMAPQHSVPLQQQQRSLVTDRSSNTNSTRKQPSKQNKHMCTFPECLWSFKRFEHLKRHMLVHTGERPHVCPHPGCGKRFSRSDNFHAHYRTHEKKAFARQKNSNNSNNQLQQQQNTNNNNSTTTNALSNTNTPTNFMIKDEKDLMQQPYYNHHPYPLLPTPSHTNKPSDYMYNNNQQPHYTAIMQHHQESPTPSSRTTLHNNNSISSSSSSSTSTSSSTTNNQSTTTKGGEQKKPHACSHPNCDRRFRRLEHLKRHMRIHTHEQPFKCDYPGCLKAFSRSDNLTQHRKTHERRGSRYQQQSASVDPLAVPVTTASSSEYSTMHSATSSGSNSEPFTFDFGHNENHHHGSYDNSNNKSQQHSILGWQHPGDTSTESVGC